MTTTASLKVCSWNVHGIHNPIKRKKICYLKRERVQIALLQETYLTESEHLKLKRDWVGQVYHASFNSRSTGVAILLHKSLPLTEVEVQSDKLGRYVTIKGLLYGEYTSFMNIYAPPNHSPSLQTHMFSLFSNWLYASSIVAGDLNCCLHRLDKSHNKSQSNPKLGQSLAQRLSELDLLDTWRMLDPSDKDLIQDWLFSLHLRHH